MSLRIGAAGALALAVISAAGCSSRPTYYLEPAMNDERVAVFDVQREADAPVSIAEVDGARVDRRWGGGPYTLKVLPGGRELGVSLNIPGGWSKRIFIVASAGHTYRVEAAGRTVRITDTMTGAVSKLP